MINLHLLPMAVIMVYFPFVWRSDLASRTFHPKWYIPLALVGVACLASYFLESPPRNYMLFLLSAVLCLIFLVLAMIRIMGFSDVVLISLIMLIMQYNPLLPIRLFFPMDFFWCLLILTCAMPIYTWIYNRRKKNKYGVIQMLTHMRGSMPYTILIGAAFIITLVLEVAVA